jgi:DNA-binding NarL/FixJ family response regulator
VIPVLVVDDEPMVCAHLRTILGSAADIEVVAQAADGAEAVEAVVRHRPRVVLMDLRMPGVDGVEATGRIRAEHPGTQVVVLTTYADDTLILAALRAGALGFLTKDAGRDDIARALHAAATGQSILDPEARRALVEATAPQSPAPTPEPAALPDGLTPREGEVLRLIAAGLTNREIARKLFVSEATVKTHINNLFAKAHLRDRAQAVQYAYDHHLTPHDR